MIYFTNTFINVATSCSTTMGVTLARLSDNATTRLQIMWKGPLIGSYILQIW